MAPCRTASAIRTISGSPSLLLMTLRLKPKARAKCENSSDEAANQTHA